LIAHVPHCLKFLDSKAPVLLAFRVDFSTIRFDNISYGEDMHPKLFS